MARPRKEGHWSSQDLTSGCGLTLLAFAVFALSAWWVFVNLALAACRRHTVDACIPVLEGFVGLLVGGAGTGWWIAVVAKDRRRGTHLAIAAVITMIAWSAMVQVIGSQIVCPARDSSYVCPEMTAIGTGMLAVTATLTPRLADQIERLVSRREMRR